MVNKLHNPFYPIVSNLYVDLGLEDSKILRFNKYSNCVFFVNIPQSKRYTSQASIQNTPRFLALLKYPKATKLHRGTLKWCN